MLHRKLLELRRLVLGQSSRVDPLVAEIDRCQIVAARRAETGCFKSLLTQTSSAPSDLSVQNQRAKSRLRCQQVSL